MTSSNTIVTLYFAVLLFISLIFYERDEDEAVAFWLNYVDKLVCYPSVLLG